MNPLDIAQHTLPRLRNRLRAWQLRASARSKTGNGMAAPVATEVHACRACGRPEVPLRVLGPVPITHAAALRQRDYRLLHCPECDVVWLDPLPGAEDLAVLYEASAQFTDPLYSEPEAAARIVRGYGRRLALHRLLPRTGDALLEIGAGPAWISRVWKQHLGDARTVAQDVSDECAASCPFVDEYVVGGLARVPRARYRLVALTHVIEHVPQPAELLAQAAEFLQPGGHLYLTAPFRPPLWRPVEGLAPWLHYSYLHVPAHIHYLSERWLREQAPACALELLSWDASHDGHRAFEAVLQRR